MTRPGGPVCVAGQAGNAAVHYHGYIERFTARTIVLRRRRDGHPHRFRRQPPHTSVPAVPWGPLTLAATCQKK